MQKDMNQRLTWAHSLYLSDFFSSRSFIITFSQHVDFLAKDSNSDGKIFGLLLWTEHQYN